MPLVSFLLFAQVLVGTPLPARAQAPEKITLSLEVRTEGRNTRDESAARLGADVQTALEAISDVVMVPRPRGSRTIWIIVGSGPSASNSASVVVTERYDRKTLLTLGVKDEGMAERMMLQRIVIDHELFTGRDLQALATRIVAWVNDDILAKAR